jgi:hypothetical protein
MHRRQYEAIRNRKRTKLTEDEARDEARAALRACGVTGICTICGADEVEDEPHLPPCPKADR